MKTLATYPTLIEAQLKQSLLRSAGIEAFIPDENTIQIDWMYRNAIGGIRLQVSNNQLEEALELLGLEPAQTEDIIKCPQCGSHKIHFLMSSIWSLIPALIFGLLFPTRKVTCMECKHIFKYENLQ